MNNKFSLKRKHERIGQLLDDKIKINVTLSPYKTVLSFDERFGCLIWSKESKRLLVWNHLMINKALFNRCQYRSKLLVGDDVGKATGNLLNRKNSQWKKLMKIPQ